MIKRRRLDVDLRASGAMNGDAIAPHLCYVGSCARVRFKTHRFKVENQLNNWRKDSTFDVKGFEQGLLVGRLL